MRYITALFTILMFSLVHTYGQTDETHEGNEKVEVSGEKRVTGQTGKNKPAKAPKINTNKRVIHKSTPSEKKKVKPVKKVKGTTRQTKEQTSSEGGNAGTPD